MGSRSAAITHERRLEGLRNLRTGYDLVAAVGFWKSLHDEDLIDVYAETVAENERLREAMRPIKPMEGDAV